MTYESAPQARSAAPGLQIARGEAITVVRNGCGRPADVQRFAE
jgi:hypothetical protein